MTKHLTFAAGERGDPATTPGPHRRSGVQALLAAGARRLASLRAHRGRALAAVAVAGMLAAACGSDNQGALQDFPGTTRQQLISDRDNPAVLLIVNEYKATISVPTLGYNDAALNALANQVAAEAVAGQIGSDQDSLYNAFVDAIAGNPGAYFTASQPMQQQDATIDYQCTGSIVTPDGYVVTAAHCTKAADDAKAQAYVENGLKPILTAAVQKFLADNPGFSQDQQNKLAGAVTDFLAGQAQLSDETQSVFTGLFTSSSTGDRQATKKPLSIVTQGNAPKSSSGPFGDKDVSILKLDGYSNLPTLPVGSDADVDSGSQLYITGYPVLAESGNLDNLSTPTVTAGSISAKKTSDDGVPLLETSATVSGGNSGGPGLDQDGDMVGVVSYGASSNGASYNYLIGGSVVEQFLREKNIRPSAGATTQLYDVALNDYYRHYYKRALQEFQQVKGLYPAHPYVDGFIQKSQTAIEQGRDQTPLLDGTMLIVVAAAAAAFVLLVVVVVVLLVMRRRRRGPRSVEPVVGNGTVTAAQASYVAPAAEQPAAPAWPAAQPTPTPAPAAPAQPVPAQSWQSAIPNGTAPPQAAETPTNAPQPASPQIGMTARSGDTVWMWDGQRWIPAPPGGDGHTPPPAG